MSEIQDLTKLVVAAWILSGERRIPTSHGLLDRALKAALDRGAFPDLKSRLHFVDSRVGLQCVEVPELLDWAQRAQLTTAPNPSYRYTQLQVTDKVARKILRKLRVNESDARRWGEELVAALAEVRESDADNEGVEEY